MNLLVELMLAATIIGIIGIPLLTLATGNIQRVTFTVSRKEAFHLAQALVERYRDDGLGSFLRSARHQGGVYTLTDPHCDDAFLNGSLTEHLCGGGRRVKTRVLYYEDFRGTTGLGCLRSFVEVSDGTKTHRASAARFVLDATAARR